MQQTIAKKEFTPPNVLSREFKRDNPPPTEDYREQLFALESGWEEVAEGYVAAHGVVDNSHGNLSMFIWI